MTLLIAVLSSALAASGTSPCTLVQGTLERSVPQVRRGEVVVSGCWVVSQREAVAVLRSERAGTDVRAQLEARDRKRLDKAFGRVGLQVRLVGQGADPAVWVPEVLAAWPVRVGWLRPLAGEAELVVSDADLARVGGWAGELQALSEWTIGVVGESEVGPRDAAAREVLLGWEAFTEEEVGALVAAGYHAFDDLVGAEPSELAITLGVAPEEAAGLQDELAMRLERQSGGR
jgi:hypothetical protein